MTPSVSHAEIEHDAELLAALHARISALDPDAHQRPEHAELLAQKVAAPLRVALSEAIAILSRLEQSCELGDPETGEWGDHLEHTGVHDVVGVGSALTDELWQQVGNLAFAGRSELRRAERVLTSGVTSHAERLVACESARRKLRRAIHALLAAVGQALGRTFEIDPVDAEVEAAIAVRRMYAKFRRSLPACDLDDPIQVRRALRYAAVSLAVMVGSADFSEIRVPDRQLLLGLQARILSWAREGGTEAVGAQLYQDLLTAADLLRSINQRQELVARDRVVEEQLARLLVTGRAATELATAMLPALAQLAGRDDHLDALIERASGDLSAGALVASVRTWLAGIGAYPPAAEAA